MNEPPIHVLGGALGWAGWALFVCKGLGLSFPGCRAAEAALFEVQAYVRTLPRCETLCTGYGPFANTPVLSCGDDGRGVEKEAQRQRGRGWVVMWVGVDAYLRLVLGLGVGAAAGVDFS